jgi:hypothetical protein
VTKTVQVPASLAPLNWLLWVLETKVGVTANSRACCRTLEYSRASA